MSDTDSARKRKFRRENRPSDPVIAVEWDKHFDFYWGEQWTPVQLKKITRRAKEKAK